MSADITTTATNSALFDYAVMRYKELLEEEFGYEGVSDEEMTSIAIYNLKQNKYHEMREKPDELFKHIISSLDISAFGSTGYVIDKKRVIAENEHLTKENGFIADSYPLTSQQLMIIAIYVIMFEEDNIKRSDEEVIDLFAGFIKKGCTSQQRHDVLNKFKEFVKEETEDEIYIKSCDLSIEQGLFLSLCNVMMGIDHMADATVVMKMVESADKKQKKITELQVAKEIFWIRRYHIEQGNTYIPLDADVLGVVAYEDAKSENPSSVDYSNVCFH